MLPSLYCRANALHRLGDITYRRTATDTIAVMGLGGSYGEAIGE